MGRKPIYVLILTASLQLACYKEPPAPQSSFNLTIKTRDAIPSYSVAGIAPNGSTRPAPLAPGRIVSIYGQNLGPIKPCSGSADPIERETPSPHRPNQTLIETWIFPVTLCGVEVQVGGLNAGLLYVSAGQINLKSLNPRKPKAIPASAFSTMASPDPRYPSPSLPLHPPARRNRLPQKCGPAYRA